MPGMPKGLRPFAGGLGESGGGAPLLRGAGRGQAYCADASVESAAFEVSRAARMVYADVASRDSDTVKYELPAMKQRTSQSAQNARGTSLN